MVCDDFDKAILSPGRLRLGNAPSFNTFREGYFQIGSGGKMTLTNI